jgi:hypothetical protein
MGGRMGLVHGACHGRPVPDCSHPPLPRSACINASDNGIHASDTTVEWEDAPARIAPSGKLERNLIYPLGIVGG